MNQLNLISHYVDKEILRELNATSRDSWDEFLLYDY